MPLHLWMTYHGLRTPAPQNPADFPDPPPLEGPQTVDMHYFYCGCPQVCPTLETIQEAQACRLVDSACT